MQLCLLYFLSRHVALNDALSYTILTTPSQYCMVFLQGVVRIHSILRQWYSTPLSRVWSNKHYKCQLILVMPVDTSIFNPFRVANRKSTLGRSKITIYLEIMRGCSYPNMHVFKKVTYGSYQNATRWLEYGSTLLYYLS